MGGGSYGGFDPMGGGFGMDTGGYADSAATGAKGSDKKQTNRDQQSVVPATIKQLLEAPKNSSDDSFSIDGAQLHHLKLIATIISKEEHSTNFNYMISDGSGVIECKKWVDNDAPSEDQHKCS
jgi:hypothetical protein